MDEKINGRTPGEIKAALKHCNEPVPTACTGCPYNGTYLEHAPEIDALALIERLESERDAVLEKVPKWISVKERLPRCGERVLVTNDGSVWEAYLSVSHKWVRQEFVWAATKRKSSRIL